jgi:hypothetical protein
MTTEAIPLRQGMSVHIDVGSGAVAAKVIWQNSSGVGFAFDTPIDTSLTFTVPTSMAA